jgi:glutathione S-transferase
LTIADASIAAPLTLMGPARLALESFTNIMRWLTRIQALDAWKATNPFPPGAGPKGS